MNVIFQNDKLTPFLTYLESVIGFQDSPVDDGMLNAMASYILSNRDIGALLRRYRKGCVSQLELSVAELFMDECVGLVLKELTDDFHQSVAKQLGASDFQNVQTRKGLIIIRIRS